MSVLIYPDKKMAAKAAAALLAAQIIAKPSSVIGLDYDPTLLPCYHELADTAVSGLLDWSRVTVFQLCERAKSDEAISLRDLLWRALLHRTNLPPKAFFAPPEESGDWVGECLHLEEAILHRGGLDLALLGLKDDATVLFNRPASALAHGAHTVHYREERVLTAGIPTVMQARKLIVLATGEERREAVLSMLREAITPQRPASFLQLHANVTFILDAAAAEKL
ncbi:MAG: 6-phosphogluconolactonase [Clostridiales bacterium]|nr:6-phosphogluconolactonase [Clostridiales bacterium]